MPLDPKTRQAALTLNESPSEKEGKFLMRPDKKAIAPTLNESPSEKEGKSGYRLPSRLSPGFPQ